MILDSQMYYNNTLQIRAFFKWQPLRLYNRYTNNSESKCFIKISMAYSFVLMCLITTSNFMTKLLKWWYLVGMCLVWGCICRTTESATTPWFTLCTVGVFDKKPPRTFGMYLWRSSANKISFIRIMKGKTYVIYWDNSMYSEYVVLSKSYVCIWISHDIVHFTYIITYPVLDSTNTRFLLSAWFRPP